MAVHRAVALLHWGSATHVAILVSGERYCWLVSVNLVSKWIVQLTDEALQTITIF